MGTKKTSLRKLSLPPSWYSLAGRGDTEDSIETFLNRFTGFSSDKAACRAAVSPHAGWYYSGIPAALSVSSLDRAAETVAVIGGHLPAGAPFLFAEEDGVDTPLGPLLIDGELRKTMTKQLKSAPDRFRDNTVEVLLPMVRYFFPKARLLWVRFPADVSAFNAGKALAESADALGRRIVVLGSTDLTHYGDNYGFSPQGRGKKALDWVKEVNDAAFISAVLSADPGEVLHRAETDFSACSAGAVLGVLGFVHPDPSKVKVLDYRTSADAGEETAEIPDSFVGYASISWE